MRIAIDTNRFVDFAKGLPEAVERFRRADHQLRRQGTPIPTNDLWIAALVVQHQLHLFARDAHFDRLPQIPRL